MFPSTAPDKCHPCCFTNSKKVSESSPKLLNNYVDSSLSFLSVQQKHEIFKRISEVSSVVYTNTCLSQEFHICKTNLRKRWDYLGKKQVVKYIWNALYLPSVFWAFSYAVQIYFVPFPLQPLEQKFLKENVNRDILYHKLLETGGLKKIQVVRVDNWALGSPQLVCKATVTAKIWL